MLNYCQYRGLHSRWTYTQDYYSMLLVRTFPTSIGHIFFQNSWIISRNHPLINKRLLLVNVMQIVYVCLCCETLIQLFITLIKFVGDRFHYLFSCFFPYPSLPFCYRFLTLATQYDDPYRIQIQVVRTLV